VTDGHARHATSDVAARERAARELDTTFLVEASAGTGKTHLLVDRMLAILTSGRASLRELVAITFTEKSAGELKLRLRRRLDEVIATGSATLPPETHARCLQALADLPLAPISTIHAFAASLLRERPVEAGLDPNFRVMDELRGRVRLTEAWRLWREQAFSSPDPVLERALRAGIGPEEIWKIVELLAANQDVLEEFAPAPGDTAQATLAQADTLLREELLPGFEHLIASLATTMAACRAEEDKGLAQMRALLAEWRALPAQTPEQVARWLLRHGLPGSPGGNRKHWSDPHVLVDHKQAWRQLGEVQERYLTLDRHGVLVDLVDRVGSFLGGYRERRHDAGLLDFQDLLLEARRLLRDNLEVRRYFQERFRYLLVDEFQDTDPLQAEIVFYLAEQEPRATDWQDVVLEPGKLFLVGDPKQSIYRFRRADIEVYEQATDVVLRQPQERGDRLVLMQNFRSARAPIDWVNRVFERVIQAVEGGRIQPDYHPLHLSERTRAMAGAVRVLTPSAARCASLPAKQRVEELARLEAELLAATMRAQVAQQATLVGPPDAGPPRPVRYADMALLLPTYNHLEAYEEALNAASIPYRLLGGKSFYQRIETHAVVALLRAIDNPHDPAAIVAALRSPAFGVSDEELLQGKREGALDYLGPAGAAGRALQANLFCAARGGDNILVRALQTLRELHDLRNRLPLAVLLNHALRRTQLLAVLYLMPQGEQRVANVQRIVEAARSQDRDGAVSLRRFTDELTDLLDSRAPEAEAVALTEGEGAVHILTIHRAKGLEFPLVFLADLSVGLGSRQRWPELIVHRARRRFAIGLNSKLVTRNHAELRAHEQLCQEAESCRLLYVAATRARNVLYLVHPRPAEIKGYLELLAPGLPPAEQLEPGVDRVQEDTPAETAVRVEVDAQVESPAATVRPCWNHWRDLDAIAREEEVADLTQRETAWRAGLDALKTRACRQVQMINPSQLKDTDTAVRSAVHGADAAWLDQAVRPDPDEATPAPAGAGTHRGARVGIAVHEVLARVFELDDHELRAYVQTCCRSQALGPDEKSRVQALVGKALTSPIMARARRSPRVMTEVPFVRPLADGTYVEGRIDLLFEEGTGLVLVDFKTDDVRDEALRTRAHEYRAALAEYARSAQQLSGRPVDAWLCFLEAEVAISLSEMQT